MAGRDPADCDEGQRADDLVVGEGLCDRRLDLDSVLEQHDRGIRADCGPDQFSPVEIIEHLNGQQQIIRMSRVLSGMREHLLRMKHEITLRTLDVIAGRAHHRRIRAADDGDAGALACQHGTIIAANGTRADHQDVRL
jgi:hypothetical protein